MCTLHPCDSVMYVDEAAHAYLCFRSANRFMLYIFVCCVLFCALDPVCVITNPVWVSQYITFTAVHTHDSGPTSARSYARIQLAGSEVSRLYDDSARVRTNRKRLCKRGSFCRTQSHADTSSAYPVRVVWIVHQHRTAVNPAPYGLVYRYRTSFQPTHPYRYRPIDAIQFGTAPRSRSTCTL